jgi:hypothetical protein
MLVLFGRSSRAPGWPRAETERGQEADCVDMLEKARKLLQRAEK